MSNEIVILIRSLTGKNPVGILRLTPQDDFHHFEILQCHFTLFRRRRIRLWRRFLNFKL